MALIAKGNLSFKLQVDQSFPVPDSVYQLRRRQENWQGKKSDLDAFINARPFGSVHPNWSFLRLAEIGQPQNREAGMVDVWLSYAGNNDPLISSTAASDTQTQRTSVNGLKYRRIRITDGGVWSTPFYAYEVADAVKETVARVPTITFRYAFNGRVYVPKFGALATLELANAPVSDGGGYASQVSAWRLADGTYPSWVLAAYAAAKKSPDDSAFIFVPNSTTGTATPPTAGTPPVVPPQQTAIISTGISCNPVGLSGWYECDETWEKSYVAQS